MAVINVGLNVGPTPTWSIADVVIAISLSVHIDNTIISVTQYCSDTENTAVVVLRDALTEKEANELCYVLHQECIAQLAPIYGGQLLGPKAAEWGEFNPEYFILPDGTKANV